MWAANFFLDEGSDQHLKRANERSGLPPREGTSREQAVQWVQQNNVVLWSGHDYVGPDWPIRKTDCERGRRRNLSPG
jgi:hypothetical protein